MSDAPIKLVQGAPTKENLEFTRKWKESGDFRKALIKGARHRLEQEKIQGAKDLDEMTYYFKGEKPYVVHNRVISGGGRAERDAPLRTKRAGDKSVWVEVSPGRWRLVDR